MNAPKPASPGIDHADGELEQVAAGRWRLVFRRPLRHASDVVWRAITDKEQLLAWFPHPIEGDWVVGGRLTFRSGVEGIGDFTGEVLAYDPPHLLSFSWGGDVIVLLVEPDGDGSILTLTDTFTEHGKAARDATGWHSCLDKLAFALAGERAPWDDVAQWKAMNPLYRAKLGPDAATIGPPNEMPEYS